ncbi:MAG: AAA family ATPase [Candidatus Riflebacteria bacterium]|nr:AAA family ATPase [Candidatus Riflebacteria bacterium]
MKRIPYGRSNYKSLIEDGYVYVDKTEYIRKLENLNENYIVFLRPRRFGKSLFISLLEYYYDIRHAESFQKLFGNFDIGQTPTPLHNSYYILRMSFSGINTDTPESTRKGFNDNVYGGIESFLIRYSLKMDIEKNSEASSMINSFFIKMFNSSDRKIYLLIDEYDHFANELLGFNPDFFKESISKNGFVRKFYEMLKEATTSGILDRIFITGVSPITLDSMTSGFNIARNYSRDNDFNEMMGFTENEVIDLYKQTISDEFLNERLPKLKQYYNGYLFNERSSTKLFNSDMVLYYLSYLQRRKEEISDMLDRNVVSDYGKIGNLFNIGGYNSNRMEVLDNIIEGKEQQTIITDQFNLEMPMTLNDFKSLLFYMGFLTIKRHDKISDETFLDVPNYVIKELYFGFFRSKIEEAAAFKTDSEKVSEVIREIAVEGTISKLINITEETLHRLSNRDFIKFNEKIVQAIMLTFLFETKIYYAKSEYPVEDGYIDIVLLKGSAGKPEFYSIIELKYISKTDYNDTLRVKKLEEAKNQILQYTKSEELKSFKNMRKWAVVFCKDKCVALEEVI